MEASKPAQTPVLRGVPQACFGEGSCRVVCEFNDPCQYGVYTLSEGDGIVCNAPPGGAGDGECGMGENELNSPRDCGAVCEPGETLCENGNAQILCAQNGRFLDALNCAPDEVCRNGQGCVQEMNDGPADMDMNAPEPVADAGLPIDTDMNSTVEPDMGMTVVPDMNMPIEDAAPPPVEDAAPPMEDAAPPPPPQCEEIPLDVRCRPNAETFLGELERALTDVEQTRQLCPGLFALQSDERQARAAAGAIDALLENANEFVQEFWLGQRPFGHAYSQVLCNGRPDISRMVALFYPYLAQTPIWGEVCFSEFDPAILLGPEGVHIGALCRSWSEAYVQCRGSGLGPCQRCSEGTVPELTDWCASVLRDNEGRRALNVMALVTAARHSAPFDNRTCEGFLTISDTTLGDLSQALDCR